MTVLCDVGSVHGKGGVGKEGPRVVEVEAVQKCDCH